MTATRNLVSDARPHAMVQMPTPEITHIVAPEMTRTQVAVRFGAMLTLCTASIVVVHVVHRATGRPEWHTTVGLYGAIVVMTMPYIRGLVSDGPALLASTTVGVACALYVAADALPQPYAQSASIVRIIANQLLCTAVTEPGGSSVLPTLAGGLQSIALWEVTGASVLAIATIGIPELVCVADSVGRCIIAGVWWRWRRTRAGEIAVFVCAMCWLGEIALARTLDALVGRCPPYAALLQHSGVCGIAITVAMLAVEV